MLYLFQAKYIAIELTLYQRNTTSKRSDFSGDFANFLFVVLISMGIWIFCSPTVDSVGLVLVCFSVWSEFRQGMFAVSFPALFTRFLECLFLFSELLSP